MAEVSQDISKARKILKTGKLVGIPTETVYGLAGNAFNLDAVTAIFETKNRPSFDPLIVHVASLERAQDLVKEFPRQALDLARSYWPGPLTLLLHKKDIIPNLVTSGMETVAIRVPKQELTLQLLKSLDFPLVAPSANPFGYVSPTTAQHVNDQLGNKIDLILDGRPCRIGLESTIVGFEDDQAVIYRLGGLSREKIELMVGDVRVMPYSSSNPKAPGMLKSHYSPKVKIKLTDIRKELGSQADFSHIGVISFNSFFDELPEANQIRLAPDGNTETAAKNLFSVLRQMDKPDLKLLLVEEVPNDGLGSAINDRLRRAAAV